ncbi:hypothetical protein [Methanocella sp. MCL-LM]|uniref:hypothetical protein n=1 Tax=Methanocella sp. MCL-LM TaxID=3412035 RepID=UPI003C7966E0
MKVALVAIRECRSNLEFLAKLELLLSERAAARQEQEDRNIVFTYPDDTVEAEAVKVLRRRGYIVSRPGGIFQYPGDANLSDKLVGDLDKLCRGYIEQLEQGERVDLSGKSTAERVGYLLALVSGASLVLPSDGRNKSNDNLVVGGD